MYINERESESRGFFPKRRPFDLKECEFNFFFFPLSFKDFLTTLYGAVINFVSVVTVFMIIIAGHLASN